MYIYKYCNSFLMIFHLKTGHTFLSQLKNIGNYGNDQFKD